MVKIRLSRLGKKNDPFYRIVAIDSQKKRAGKSLAVLGYWHPRTDKQEVNKEEIKKWQEKGAIVSAAVEKLIKTK